MALSCIAATERVESTTMEPQTGKPHSLCYKDASEEQLLAAAKGGDEAAFGELIGRCAAQVRKGVMRMVRSPEDTEDVLQDSLLKAFKNLHQFRGSCRFSSWLHRIAINSALMLIRRRKVLAVISSERHEDDPSSWDNWDVPDQAPNAEQIYAKRQAIEGLSRAVDRLPISLRGVIYQFSEHGGSIQEIADAMGISVSATKSRLLRARLCLRTKLKGQQFSLTSPFY